MYHSFAPYEQDLREWWASHIYPDVNPFTHDFLLHITRPDAPRRLWRHQEEALNWLIKHHFISSSGRTRQKIGLDLDRLYDYRTSADYDDVLVGRPISLAQSSVAVARNVLNTLNSL